MRVGTLCALFHNIIDHQILSVEVKGEKRVLVLQVLPFLCVLGCGPMLEV